MLVGYDKVLLMTGPKPDKKKDLEIFVMNVLGDPFRTIAAKKSRNVKNVHTAYKRAEKLVIQHLSLTNADAAGLSTSKQ